MAGERTVRGGLLDAMRAELEPQLAEIRGRLAALEARPLPSADPLRDVPKYGPPPFEDPERLRQLVEELSEPQPAAESDRHTMTSSPGEQPCYMCNGTGWIVSASVYGSRWRCHCYAPVCVEAGLRRLCSPDSTSAAGWAERHDWGDCKNDESVCRRCGALWLHGPPDVPCRKPPEPAERCGECEDGWIRGVMSWRTCPACNGTGRKPQPAAEVSGEMVPTVWESNGEAGDSTELCSVCRASVAGPHTWEECARGSAQSYFLALDKALETAAERDTARRELERHKNDPDPHDPDGWVRRSALNHWVQRAEAAERRAERLAAVVEAAKSWLIMWDHWRGTVIRPEDGSDDRNIWLTKVRKTLKGLADADVEGAETRGE